MGNDVAAFRRDGRSDALRNAAFHTFAAEQWRPTFWNWVRGTADARICAFHEQARQLYLYCARTGASVDYLGDRVAAGMRDGSYLLDL